MTWASCGEPVPDLKLGQSRSHPATRRAGAQVHHDVGGHCRTGDLVPRRTAAIRGAAGTGGPDVVTLCLAR